MDIGQKTEGHELFPETKVVSWFMCRCDWVTKYCEENHKAYARVPISVLKKYEFIS